MVSQDPDVPVRIEFVIEVHIIHLYFFSLHLFKNYGRSTKCVDMELTYFLECTSLAKTSLAKTDLSKTGFQATCRPNGKFSLLLNQYISKFFMDLIIVNYIMTHNSVSETSVSEIRVIHDAYSCILNNDKLNQVNSHRLSSFNNSFITEFKNGYLT